VTEVRLLINPPSGHKLRNRNSLLIFRNPLHTNRHVAATIKPPSCRGCQIVDVFRVVRDEQGLKITVVAKIPESCEPGLYLRQGQKVFRLVYAQGVILIFGMMG
jgi:hypothetical protein